MSDFINDFTTRLIRSGLASWWTISGCWNSDIQNLESRFDIKLPEIYKDFLKKMGRSAGKFMRGTDVFYPAILENREGLEDISEPEDSSFILHKDFFVFLSHQGYIYHFFNVAEDSFDPPVYGYKEGDLQIECINKSFSTFLERILEEEKQLGISNSK